MHVAHHIKELGGWLARATGPCHAAKRPRFSVHTLLWCAHHMRQWAQRSTCYFHLPISRTSMMHIYIRRDVSHGCARKRAETSKQAGVVGCWTSTRGERAAVLQHTAAGVQCAVLWQRYRQRYSHRVTSVAAGSHRALRALGELRALRKPRASLQRTASLTQTPTPGSRPRCTRTVCALRRHLQQPGRQARVLQGAAAGARPFRLGQVA